MTNFTTHTPGTASDEGRELLDAAKAKFGFIPNLLKKTGAEVPLLDIMLAGN